MYKKILAKKITEFRDQQISELNNVLLVNILIFSAWLSEDLLLDKLGSQEKITDFFDDIFEKLKDTQKKLYDKYYNEFREEYINQLADFPNAFKDVVITKENGETIRETKTIKEWVNIIIENIVEVLDHPETDRERDLREQKERRDLAVKFQIIRENSEAMESRIRGEYYNRTTISPDGEYVIYTGADNKTNWIFSKDGTLYDELGFSNNLSGIYFRFSPDGRWLYIQAMNNSSKYFFYDFEDKKLISGDKAERLMLNYFNNLEGWHSGHRGEAGFRAKKAAVLNENVEQRKEYVDIQEIPGQNRIVCNEIGNRAIFWILDLTNKQILGACTVPVPCNKPTFSTDGEFIFLQSIGDNRKFWIFEKNGILYSEITLPEDCYLPKVSPKPIANIWLYFQSKINQDNAWFYDLTGKSLRSLAESKALRDVMRPDEW